MSKANSPPSDARPSGKRPAGPLCCALTLTLCVLSDVAAADNTPRLSDVTSLTGITFQHCDGSTGLYRIPEAAASGLALFDYNGDGRIDIYFLSGAYPKDSHQDTVPRNALYRNDGNWRFTDVTQEAGVGDPGFGLGVAVGDYDNDGDLDIYINNFGPNVLYQNNSDGTFTAVTHEAGVVHGTHMGAGANFLDMDMDGDLDLYVSSYTEYSRDTHVPSAPHGYPVYPGPSLYTSTYEALFRNNNDGTFTDVSQASGIAFQRCPGMGTICSDFDRDGDTDIFVANDTQPNFLFQNDGSGHFEEVGLLSGMAFDVHGNPQGTMGIDLGDIDNDGWPDLYVTTYQNEWASLLRNLGDGAFEDVTFTSGAGMSSLTDVTWGIGFADFENDGDRDIFVACGHVQDKIDLFDDRTTYLQTNRLYMNIGNGKFVDVSDRSGEGMKVNLSSRGIGLDDLDNDGDVDVVILNSRREPTLLRNDTPNQGHWLQTTLQGTTSNRDGIGAQVRVFTQGVILSDEVHSGRSYQRHFGTHLYFGLGKQASIERIEVLWIGGGRDAYENVNVDQHVLLIEGESTARPIGPAKD